MARRYLLACEADIQVARVKRLPYSLRTPLMAVDCKGRDDFKEAQQVRLGGRQHGGGAP